MERYWPEEALEFEGAVRGALRRAGGVDLARRCEADPEVRVAEVKPVLASLGLLDLDVLSGQTEAAATALGVRAAGSVVCPWPVVHRLAVPAELQAEIDLAYLCDGAPSRVEHLDLGPRAAVVDVVAGEVCSLRAEGGVAPMPLDPFGVPCATTATEGALDADTTVGPHLVLDAFWVVGALGTARDLAAEHARDRRQFGRRIVDFGGIQWHLSDIAVAHDGLWELAGFSLARLIDGRLERSDALALAYATRAAAESVLGHAHQILAAMGLCEEHDLSVIDRHLQPFLRRPFGATRSLSLLAEEIDRSGFGNLYPITGSDPSYREASAQA